MCHDHIIKPSTGRFVNLFGLCVKSFQKFSQTYWSLLFDDLKLSFFLELLSFLNIDFNSGFFFGNKNSG